MDDIFNPTYSAETVIKVAGTTRSNLANWLRRGLLDRLSTEKEHGRHRRYSVADIITVAAMNQLVQLGMKPSRFTNGMAEVITSNAVHWFFADRGKWGQTRPEHEDMHRWLAIFFDHNVGALNWSMVLNPDSARGFYTSAVTLFDCQRLSRNIVAILEKQ